MINVLLRKSDSANAPIVRTYPTAGRVEIVSLSGGILLQLFDTPTSSAPIAQFSWDEIVGYEVVDAPA